MYRITGVTLRCLMLFLALVFAISSPSSAALADGDGFGYVFTRVPRTQGPVMRTFRDGSRFSVNNPDLNDRLPDTRLQIEGFNAPGQLVHVSKDGTSRVLYDCMSEPTPCVPLDAAVSFDGRKVLFSVIRGGLLQYGKKIAKPLEAQLYVADLDTGTTKPLAHEPGDFDMGPAFLPDGRIMFSSDRAGVWGTVLRRATPPQHESFQLFIAQPDGTQARNVSPHEVDGALHPYVLSSGRVIYSTWQLNHMLAYRANNGAPNKFGTLHNMFWVASVDHGGGDWQSLFGAHTSKYGKGRFRFSVRALHFLGEMSSGWICATNYYRRNNFGGGEIVCWEPEADQVEGMSAEEVKVFADIFRPRNMINVAPWARSEDSFSRKQKGIFTGKLRDPDGLPNEQLMLTFLRGACGRQFGRVEKNLKEVQDQPVGCDAGIYRTSKIPSASPDDLIKIQDEPEWHEFGARMAEPYVFVYGREKPAQPKLRRTDDGRCILGSASLLTETTHFASYKFGNYKACGLQGCEIDGLPKDEVKALRFWEVHPNRDRGKNHLQSTVGNVLALLGDVPVRNDGSSVVELPCDTPYVMAGVDSQGRVVKRDQVVQSLRPGEKRVCGGCHLHSRPGPKFETTEAGQATDIPVLGRDAVQTLQNGALVRVSSTPLILEYNQDIFPILEQRCAGCHSGADAAGGLQLDLPGIGRDSTYRRLVWDHNQTRVPADQRIRHKKGFALQRPNTSKYVNAVFARESLLYWKAAGERTDGRTDSQYPDDIDFGPAHAVTALTPDELRKIATWLDSGAYASGQ